MPNQKINNDDFIKDINNVIFNTDSKCDFTIEVPQGYNVNIKYLSDEQMEAKRNQSDALIEKNKQKGKNNKEMKKLTEVLGSFYHFRYEYNNKIFKELSIIDIGRLFILSDYVLNSRSRRKIKKKDLPEIWGTTSRNSINETFKSLLEYGYMKLDKDGNIMINENIMKVGEGYKIKYPTTYTRVFCEPGIDFYEGLPSKQKKYYGLIIAILPFVNFKHNVLCSNPTETDIDKLELLNWKDLCKIVGYDESHSTRLSKELIKLKVYDSEVFMYHTGANGTRITINPSLYYAGDKPEDLEYLFNLFKMNPKKNKK